MTTIAPSFHVGQAVTWRGISAKVEAWEDFPAWNSMPAGRYYYCSMRIQEQPFAYWINEQDLTPQ